MEYRRGCRSHLADADSRNGGAASFAAGRRPPLPPVYEGLRSGASQWAPWELLIQELYAANEAMLDLLESASALGPEYGTDAPAVKTVMVALRTAEDGSKEPQIWFEELRWKEYALLQRLHLLDHRTQIKNLRASLGSGFGR